TAHTLTDKTQIEAELAQIRLHGYALDRQEFLDGLVCLAVLVPNASGRSNLCVAVQAPMMRKSIEDLLKLLPALRLAAESIARLEDHSDLGSPQAEPVAVGW